MNHANDANLSTFETTVEGELVSYGRFMQRHSPEAAEVVKEAYHEATAAILQAHKEAVEAVIGEDELVSDDDMATWVVSEPGAAERNELRAQQRQRLKEVSSPTNEENAK